MAPSVPPVLKRQLARVSRRLFLQTLLNCLVWCWTAALAAAVAWMLVQPFALEAPPAWLKWAVAGGAVGVATLTAAVLAVVLMPSRLAAALLLDERFGLKERVTTSLTLAPGTETTAAGQALLADVQKHVSDLQVARAFPLQLSWSAALVPVLVVALGGVGLLYKPELRKPVAKADDDLSQPVVNPADLDKNLNKLVKKPRPKDGEEKSAESDKLEQINAELKDLVNKPRKTKQDVLDRAKDMTALENQMNKLKNEMGDKMQAVKDQLKQMDKLSGNPKNGPARELEKALKDGDFDKAKEEADRLAKKLQDGELSEKEQEQLQKQIDELKEKLEQMADLKNEEEKLKELASKGQLDQEALEREMDQLEKKKDQMKDLKELSRQLEQCKNCMKAGDKEGAAEALKKAAGKCKQLGGSEKDLKDLEEKLNALTKARNSASDLINSRPVPGAGARPEERDQVNSIEHRVRTDFDPKGQKEIVDFVNGRSFKKKSSAEIAGQVEQASQEAPEAIERQRIPRAASDMARGYYEKLRQQAEKENKPAKP